MKTRKQS